MLEEHAEALEAALTTGRAAPTEARDAGAQAALATRACAAAVFPSVWTFIAFDSNVPCTPLVELTEVY